MLGDSEMVRRRLDQCLRYQQAYRNRPTDDWWVKAMREENEIEIVKLQAELLFLGRNEGRGTQ